MKTIILAIRRAWGRHGTLLLAISAVILGAGSARMLMSLFRVLVVEPGGAVDLKYYYNWVGPWFDGAPFYARVERPEYPPASLVLLWPLVGWLSLEQTRWMWAAVDAASLLVLSVGFVRATCARGLWARACAACMLASMLPTSVAIGNGQLVLHVLPVLLAVVFIVRRWPPGWIRDAIAAILMLFTFVKPTISAPFVWIVLLSPGGWRPLAGAFAGYAGLTVFAATFQHQDAWTLWMAAVANGQRNAQVPSGNLHYLLTVLGAPSLMLPASALIFAWAGWWTYRHRRDDVWVLLGVAAIVACIWTYHRVYDDVLVVIAEVALFRIAGRRFYTDDLATVAGTLAAISVLAFVPDPLMPDELMRTQRPIIAVLDLAFLVYYSRRRPSGVPTEATGALATAADTRSR